MSPFRSSTRTSTAAFLIYYALVDSAGGNVVCLGSAHIGEAFVVPQVEVGLMAVFGNIAFAMFVGVESARIDVDVRVELLNGLRMFCIFCILRFRGAKLRKMTQAVK